MLQNTLEKRQLGIMTHIFLLCSKLAQVKTLMLYNVEYNGSYGSASRPGSGIAGSVAPKVGCGRLHRGASSHRPNKVLESFMIP
uniref:Uncharacterized protein n=1 Tax=Triticum urartu TaxID=4572 RepID=A0A8R7Q2P8_TRIUA